MSTTEVDAVAGEAMARAKAAQSRRPDPPAAAPPSWSPRPTGGGSSSRYGGVDGIVGVGDAVDAAAGGPGPFKEYMSRRVGAMRSSQSSFFPSDFDEGDSAVDGRRSEAAAATNVSAPMAVSVGVEAVRYGGPRLGGRSDGLAVRDAGVGSGRFERGLVGVSGEWGGDGGGMGRVPAVESGGLGFDPAHTRYWKVADEDDEADMLLAGPTVRYDLGLPLEEVTPVPRSRPPRPALGGNVDHAAESASATGSHTLAPPPKIPSPTFSPSMTRKGVPPMTLTGGSHDARLNPANLSKAMALMDPIDLKEAISAVLPAHYGELLALQQRQIQDLQTEVEKLRKAVSEPRQAHQPGDKILSEVARFKRESEAAIAGKFAEEGDSESDEDREGAVRDSVGTRTSHSSAAAARSHESRSSLHRASRDSAQRSSATSQLVADYKREARKALQAGARVQDAAAAASRSSDQKDNPLVVAADAVAKRTSDAKDAVTGNTPPRPNRRSPFAGQSRRVNSGGAAPVDRGRSIAAAAAASRRRRGTPRSPIDSSRRAHHRPAERDAEHKTAQEDAHAWALSALMQRDTLAAVHVPTGGVTYDPTTSLMSSDLASEPDVGVRQMPPKRPWVSEPQGPATSSAETHIGPAVGAGSPDVASGALDFVSRIRDTATPDSSAARTDPPSPPASKSVASTASYQRPVIRNTEQHQPSAHRSPFTARGGALTDETKSPASLASTADMPSSGSPDIPRISYAPLQDDDEDEGNTVDEVIAGYLRRGGSAHAIEGAADSPSDDDTQRELALNAPSMTGLRSSGKK